MYQRQWDRFYRRKMIGLEQAICSSVKPLGMLLRQYADDASIARPPRRGREDMSPGPGHRRPTPFR